MLCTIILYNYISRKILLLSCLLRLLDVSSNNFVLSSMHMKKGSSLCFPATNNTRNDCNLNFKINVSDIEKPSKNLN